MREIQNEFGNTEEIQAQFDAATDHEKKVLLKLFRNLNK